jgi:ABC-type multidrug transport system fused ATPase/permease subunit
MWETLLGGVFGGVLRLAPEVLKFFDQKNERKHELAMVSAEMEFAKVRGEIAMRQTEAQMTMAEVDAISQAFKEQSATAQAAGKFVSAISALVRPFVTYLFVIAYAAVKVAAFLIALEQNGDWKVVLTTMWGVDDMAVLNMILSFWFVGRVYERTRSSN